MTDNCFRHINSGLEDSLALLSVQPRHKTQEDNFDLVLQCWLHLCYLLLTLGITYQVSLLKKMQTYYKLWSHHSVLYLLYPPDP